MSRQETTDVIILTTVGVGLIAVGAAMFWGLGAAFMVIGVVLVFLAPDRRLISLISRGPKK